MARRSFYSFHYKPDNWRASQVRNMGVVDGNRPCSDNDWESITKGGDEKIKKWIAEQLDGKSCVIVLIGSGTAGRKWINHEIVRADTGRVHDCTTRCNPCSRAPVPKATQATEALTSLPNINASNRGE